MKRQHSLIILFTLIIGLLFFTTSGFTMQDAIIAVVDDELITLKDLKDYIHSVYTQLKMEGRHTDAAISEIMARVEQNGIDRLIDDRLVLNAANKKGIEPKADAINEKIEAIKNRYPSKQSFIDSLSTEGLTISDLRKRFADQLKSQFFIDTQIKSTIRVNPQDITDFYNSNPHQFKRPERVHLNSIFIPFGKNPAEAEKKADQAHGMIELGRSFDDVAEKFSTAPSIGMIARGQMKPEIETRIFNLSVGGVTLPVKSDQGYFIFELKEKFPVEAVPLEEAKDQIAQFLFNQEFKEKMESWLKEAKKKTYIEIKNP